MSSRGVASRYKVKRNQIIKIFNQEDQAGIEKWFNENHEKGYSFYQWVYIQPTQKLIIIMNKYFLPTPLVVEENEVEEPKKPKVIYSAHP